MKRTTKPAAPSSQGLARAPASVRIRPKPTMNGQLLTPQDQAKESGGQMPTAMPMAMATAQVQQMPMPTAQAQMPMAQAQMPMPTATAQAPALVQATVVMPQAYPQVQQGYGQQPNQMYQQPMPMVQVVQQVPMMGAQHSPASLGLDTLCSCFDDMGETCLCFWTCGCVSFGQTMERVGKTNCCMGVVTYLFFTVVVTAFFGAAFSTGPPSAEQLNFPACAPDLDARDQRAAAAAAGRGGGHHDSTGSYGGDGYVTAHHNTSCPNGTPLATQCDALNDMYNGYMSGIVQVEDESQPWEPKQYGALQNYKRICPDPQEFVGDIIAGLILVGFFTQSRIAIALRLGIPQDPAIAQMGGLLYATGLLLPNVATFVGAMLGADLSMLGCGCWAFFAAQVQEHIQVKNAWHANGRRALGPPQMPLSPIQNTP